MSAGVVIVSASMRGQFIDAEVDLPALALRSGANDGEILRPAIVVALFTLVVVHVITPKYQSRVARLHRVGRDNVFLRPDADKDVIDRGNVDPGSGDQPGADHHVARSRLAR